MPTPTDLLRDDHVLILRTLDLLDRAAARVAAGPPVPEGWWAAAARWLRGFADAAHHAREERGLFPALLDAGLPRHGGPVDVMLSEHEEGRALLRALEAGSDADRADAARRYGRLLRAHIDKENGVLFVLADELLDGAAMGAVAATFDALAAELGPAGSRERAEQDHARLRAALGAP
jgi:hemerythrin-like domain-containing protein